MAIITGGAGGIGLAAATKFVAEGAKVLLVERALTPTLLAPMSGVMWCPLKVPVGELLIGVAHGQHKVISEGSADDLHPER